MLLRLLPTAATASTAARTFRPPQRSLPVVPRHSIIVTRSTNSTPKKSSSSSSSGRSSGGAGGNNAKPQQSSSTPRPFEPPPVKLDPSSGNELHQKAARAAQLHEELNVLLDAQAKRRAEELTRPFGAGFVEFVKQSKSEMINIFAAFFCVLLAYQISGMRSGARKLLDRAEEREAALKEMRQLLASLGGNEFAADVADKCSRALREEGGFSLSGSRATGAWGWSRGGGGSSSVGNDDHDEVNRMAGIIRPIIEREISSIVGDRALSDEEMEEKRLRDLQKEMGVREKVPSGSSENRSPQMSEPMEVAGTETKAGDGPLGGMEELIVELQEGNGKGEGEGGEKGAKIVKRRKYAGSI